ncbi:MAG: DUF5011 domain-containing protein [Ruminococcaceae bacterium]|nr:DUF5011 domain-containing protein [Oscillospiraceae bacterium]
MKNKNDTYFETSDTAEIPEAIISEKKRMPLPALIFTIVNFALLVLVTTCSLIIHKNVFTLAFELVGDSEVTVEYGEVYEEQGTKESFFGTILLKDGRVPEVETFGEVNTEVVGTYTVEYKATYLLDYHVGEKLFTETLRRTVKVIDTVAPEIKLETKDGWYTLPGQPYSEEGFAASDNYDGDITSKVEVKEKDGKVYYIAEDSSGNKTEAVREIFYDDPIPPEIGVLGYSEIILTVGDNYGDAGCTAFDNVDGDLTSSIIMSGEVLTDTPGTYTLTYSVADSYGNEASCIRTVKINPYVPPVVFPSAPAVSPSAPNGKVIYLTFDDGPGKHTERLLDILDKYDVKATFFVVNNPDYMHLLPRMVSSGHTVGMHANEHVYNKVYASDDAYYNDLYTIQSAINSYTGITPTILRFPGGGSNRVSRICPGIMTRLTAGVKDMGYRYFDWNVDSCDAGGTRSAWGVYNNVIKYIPKFEYSVVLQHDIYGYSVDAVENIINWGIENGYTFLPLTSDSPVCEHTVKN